jgi:hypothetical protein
MYRAFLSWSGDSALCGTVAEKVAHSSLISLRGETLLYPDQKPGRLTHINGTRVRGGPLDGQGTVFADPTQPGRGFNQFAYEVKNLRSWLYPHHAEVWDILAKMGGFPEVLPILLARRIAAPTLVLFRGIGAIGGTFEQQFFSTRIDASAFHQVTENLGFADATRVPDPPPPSSRIVGLFRTALPRIVSNGEMLVERSARLWRIAAPIAADYMELRRDSLRPWDRHRLFMEAIQRFRDAGLAIQNIQVPPSDSRRGSTKTF